MPRPWRLRQIVTPTTTITEAANPLIPTEVFVELNPELVQFYEKEYLPGNIPYYGNLYQSWSCAPRRFCVPRPCTPV